MSEFDITNPLNISFLNRQIANKENDYDKFIDELYKELIACFESLEEEANEHHDKGETGISSSVKMYLKGAKYDCTTETNSNGHVDLTVRENRFKWLGEAKLHRGNSWTYHGFNQLTENYTTGRPNASRGGIIVYNTTVKKPSTQCAEEWKQYIEQKPLSVTCSDYNANGYFDMVIPKHPRSGLPYYIRNFFVTLHYTPSEKVSG